MFTVDSWQLSKHTYEFVAYFENSWVAVLLWGHSQAIGFKVEVNYAEQRERIAKKVQNPRLNKIMFKTLRTWKGTMEYHRTKDVLYVMQVLGHKNIKNTLIYIQLEEALFQDQVDFVSKVAKTEAEACVLIEAGFEFVCDFDGHKLFRKRK